MIYGYIRVSTDRQTVENQRFEIQKFCESNNMEVGSWIHETISGTKDVDRRKLGKLLKGTKEGDIIICSEISRLGRSLFMIMSILDTCMRSGVKVWTIKDGYRLGDDVTSKVLAFAFSLSAEIERNLISQRTREALARRKAEGIILGRQPGSVVRRKLDGKERQIRKLLESGVPQKKIAKYFNVNRSTVSVFIKLKALK